MSYEKVTQFKSKVIIGTKQTIKAMNNGEVSEVFVAEDAAPHITSQVLEVAKRLNIPYGLVESKKQLGKACDIDVGASAVAIKQD